MVWIFGGVLQFGWNGVPTYDGSSLAANQDVILVAINYRTNGKSSLADSLSVFIRMVSRESS